ncbi:MAG TPA: pyridoxamine 5'-phosphate oxidase family protein [Hungateiclostridium thermocellum]|jgi:pyridoxamine 5'-phosphate oxidase|uniref:Pyridoxamine 5'-phosphate oxidase-related FMN-binding protein n=2 Tax=Acetivibrio thermocellus TaxID=1515 RepID=A3DIQ5_ACET2|nr:pyridoxamine 5'-phosphate oxidase family protein [Acetivibrio thermocellus]CDG37099.1 pyridoxamine 5'-phosphate oxidase-like FMN-binding protein [Acetivibrio thermocellus BC1]ABN53834.1 pyridoxamine 5'-phosphate oxidase-related FMN-binding protein [Acetivibrio thermocellus ATCC 27405]ADU73318.1 pyridoxamine 5'-phosphate oxidase-related FMN-binding protein [Acetivibrio thermocellus DSM 1313]ALX07236.1 pyridoxamine 5-phosphate oxidase-related FMN-binding protein [Acetivibrio thermocellus AD2]
MDKNEIFNLINQNPVFFLATTDGDQPRVRGMLLYRADESGIIFHTGAMKDLYTQVTKNNKVELCFYGPNKGIQIRVRGELEIVDDNNLKDEIVQHPSRQFLKPWRDQLDARTFYKQFVVFRLKNGIAVKWTMEDNFAPKTEIQL